MLLQQQQKMTFWHDLICAMLGAELDNIAILYVYVCGNPSTTHKRYCMLILLFLFLRYAHNQNVQLN